MVEEAHAHGKVTINVNVDFEKLQDVFDSIDDTFRSAEGAMFYLRHKALEIFASNPHRGEALYAVLNMPWIKDNWRVLWIAWPITKRKIRRMRRDLREDEHARWARDLNRETRHRESDQ
jgi:hypothetical protein